MARDPMVYILDAMRIATLAHKGQTRKDSGEPYILHPIRVSILLAEANFVEPDIICAALLHDVLEDTPYLITDFSEAVKALVIALTRKKEENKTDAILRLYGKALIIKLADRLDNSIGDSKFTMEYMKRERERNIILLKLAEAEGYQETEIFRRVQNVVNRTK